MGAIKGNLVRPIAVSSRSRVASLPEVPTAVESGMAYEPAYWYGIFVPAATPKDVVARLADAVVQAGKSPEVITGLANQGATPADLALEPFGEYVRAEHAKWARVVRDSGAKVD